MQTERNSLWTAEQAAERLGVKLFRLYELNAKGLLPGAVRLGRSLRFDPEAIETFIKSGGAQASA